MTLSLEPIQCMYEPGYFPREEFLHHPNGELVTPYIHIHGKWPQHYITGDPVNPEKPNIVNLAGFAVELPNDRESRYPIPISV